MGKGDVGLSRTKLKELVCSFSTFLRKPKD